MNFIQQIKDFLEMDNLVEAMGNTVNYLLAFAWIIPLVIIIYGVNKKILFAIIKRINKSKRIPLVDNFMKHKVFKWMAHLMPGITIMFCSQFINEMKVRLFLDTVGKLYLALAFIMLINSFINAMGAFLRKQESFKHVPINSYIQVAKIVIYTFLGVVILVGFILDEKTVITLLSSVGGLSAILAYVFKDTLVGFISGVILTANDMVQVGDWISVPGSAADGEVVDITLNTVKVQNWDKSITTLPPSKLLTGSFMNWDHMQESNARRIKRRIYLDLYSIKFISQEWMEDLCKHPVLRTYMEPLGKEWSNMNEMALTNVALFRHFFERYLKSHEGVRGDLTCMVRELEPTPEGLPIEAYCFTATANWVEYEKTQAQIIDTIYATLPLFGLRTYQRLAGFDLRREGVNKCANENIR